MRVTVYGVELDERDLGKVGLGVILLAAGGYVLLVAWLGAL